MKNENKTKKLSGFYIALCCCVLAIGVAGYLTEQHTSRDASVVMNTENYEAENVFSDTLATFAPVIEVTAAPVPEKEVTEETAEEVTETAAIEEYAVDNPDVEDGAIMVSSEQPAFIMPLSGEVLEQFTEVLLYNNALSDWRTHSGVDFAAEEGCSVSAAAQGVIDAIYDNEMGTCVEMSHAGGFVTKYMGLNGTEDISVGSEVNSGEVIGTVGECRGENVTEPHLHFEMYKNGEAVNPTDYLPH